MRQCYCNQCRKYVEPKIETEQKTTLLDGKEEISYEYSRWSCPDCGDTVSAFVENESDMVIKPTKYCLELNSEEAEYISRALHVYIAYVSGAVSAERREVMEDSIMSMYDPLNQVWLYNHPSIEIDFSQAQHILDATRLYRYVVGEFYEKIYDSDEQMRRFEVHSNLCRRIDDLIYSQYPIDSDDDVYV